MHEITHLVPSSKEIKKASKARRAAARSTFQKLLRDRAIAKRLQTASDDQRSWETVSSNSLSGPESELEEGSIGSFKEPTGLSVIKDLQRKSYYNYSSKRITGPFWELRLIPLSKREEKLIISQCRWHGVKQLPHGEYKVAPDRYDIKIFQRKFWISRLIRQALLIMTTNNCFDCQSELLFFRRTILHLLGNGTGMLTNIQRKLLASVYFCLRQSNRLSAAGKL
jgi:hypothetical protein